MLTKNFGLYLLFSFLLFFISYSNATELGICLGYPYLGIKYFVTDTKFSFECRYAFGKGINVYSGRVYYNFYKKGKVNAFTGGEVGYIDFNIYGRKGIGAETGVFIGCEYFVLKRLSIGIDFSPTVIGLKFDKFGRIGLQYIFNLSVCYHIKPKKEK
jgi:hypothetical protein